MPAAEELRLATKSGRMPRRALAAAAGAAVAAGALLGAGHGALTVPTVSGTVRDLDGRPLPGATVRLKATEHVASTDSTGRFLLVASEPALRQRVAAWRDGYYIAGATAWPLRRDVTLVLSPYLAADTPGYDWIPPAVKDRSMLEAGLFNVGLGLSAHGSVRWLFLPLAGRLTLGCRDCHGAAVYPQWAGSAHALGARNPRFLSMYNGTDLAGNQSPPTRYRYAKDYGTFPLRPDPNRPYYGAGYKLDFPRTKGNCAACHLPRAAIADPYGTDPNTATDPAGLDCDFCHKISGVRLDASTGRPHDNVPGVMSIELTRPGADRQLFFGPFDDVDVGPDTYLPLMGQSEICAPCHTASFWGVAVYESFTEWVDSPYSSEGTTCQTCHMRPDGVTTNFAPGRGGVERDPRTVASHDFPGASDARFLRSAVRMSLTANGDTGTVEVTVAITNTGAGHSLPTDSPLRHLILLVAATDEDGRALKQLRGPRVPSWGGLGDAEGGYYGGQPGKAFAKILSELWTEVSPTGAYWNPTRLVSDNRIQAGARDVSAYSFASDLRGAVRVEARLVFRRAFKELMDQKGWQTPDIVLARCGRMLWPAPPVRTGAKDSGRHSVQ